MRQIKSTKDYSLFEYIKGNRPLGHRVKKMMKSIKRKNMLKDFPILCHPPDKKTGRRGIWDGQYRFEAAKRLGETIYFIDSESVSDISDVSHANAIQKPWSPRDYIASFVSQGNKHYIQLQKFLEEFGLPVTTSAALLMGLDAGGGGMLEQVKEGRFAFREEATARKVAGVIQALKPIVPFAADRSLAQAIIRLMKVKDFDSSRMIKKISAQAIRFRKCASWEQYVDQIEDIYNYRARRAQDIIPLSIEVKRSMARKREE